MKVVLLPGDGIGKEIAKSVIEVNKALEVDIDFEIFNGGLNYYESNGSLLEEGLIDEVRKNKILLKGPTTTPIGKGFRSINVMLRNTFETFANVRPAKSIKGINSKFNNIDLITIRENTEDLYLGKEEIIDENTTIAIKQITKQASTRIIEFAFEYAKKNNRKLVTCVHKANILKITDGLFLDTFYEIAKKYPNISHNDVIIDALTMKLVTNPNQFDVLVAPNLYGDIISDLCSGLIGGLGFAPSVNIGKDVSIYEAVHGSALDIAGKNIANPTALLLSYGMLLEDNNYANEATLLQNSIYQLISEGKYTTLDIGGKASTTLFTDKLVELIKR